MNHWLLDSLADRRKDALTVADRVIFHREMGGEPPVVNLEKLQDVAGALEIAVLDLEVDRLNADPKRHETTVKAAADAFRLLRILPLPEEDALRGEHLLRAAALAVLGDRAADAARWLRTLDEEGTWPSAGLSSNDWGVRCRAVLTDVWLKLVRKKGWDDRDSILEQVAALRETQEHFERGFLQSQESLQAKRSALELIALYHLAKAADILAHYITDGVVDGDHQVQQLLDSHFDRAVAACETARMVELEPLVRLLARAASQLVENSIWTVTRAVNSRVTQFVRELVSRGRGDRALFDVLPPQRRTLAEQGLLGSSRRAVVVSLPTSSGKTLIAQFRMLQALNQFEDRKGWVAYLAPTRALVNQVCRQLRRDFEPLGLVVERVSPAMEVDGVEARVLRESDKAAQFRVLVATPEKFDLMLRQDWEEKIRRPLTLVVVDEAHTIQESERGLRLELLLATINRECRDAQFLLLTPFIQNAAEVARWLGGQNSDDISLGVDWQPNDRAIGVVFPIDDGPRAHGGRDYRLELETVHTTRHTLAVDNTIRIEKNENIARTLSQSKNAGKLAAIATHKMMERGPVIAMHSRPDYVWKLAGYLKSASNYSGSMSENVQFVRDFVAAEMGGNFPLVELLSNRIGVHHGGLQEEIRLLMEWLFEKGELDVLVATTTIAQGVNFPVSGVVMAATQYPFGQTMPPEDFWNIAGRAGRVNHGQMGMVALVAKDAGEIDMRRQFINKQAGDLNSALIQLAQVAGDQLSDLERIVYNDPRWSGFLQYLVHTYSQMGKPADFADQIEQVLRGTLGFEKLRTSHSRIAQRLLGGIEAYARYVTRPGQPIKLVDSTGFSLQSIQTVLTHKGDLGPDSWNPENLFSSGNQTLKNMMGVLLRVPELRDNLNVVLGGQASDGDKLARIVKDWVNGESVTSIAENHFQTEDIDNTTALTKCGQNLFGKLTQTSSWGLNALLAITGGSMTEEEREALANLPSRVFYGVSSDDAVRLRLLGVPRTAAAPLAEHLAVAGDTTLPVVRNRVESLSEQDWMQAVGSQGAIYRKVWRIIDGIEL